MRIAPLGALAAFFLAAVALVGCDTTDPVPPAEPDEVAGIYEIVEFRFDPQPEFVPDVSVLDTLVLDRTSVELLDSGQFQFRYRLLGGLDNIINGTFTATSAEVSLRFEEGFESRLRALLLERTLRFERVSGERLRLSISKTVDLEAYSEEYEDTGLDLTDVPGRLELELRLENSGG